MSWTTGRSACESNGVSFGVCMHCRSAFGSNDVSFVLRKDDWSFGLLSSAMHACRSLVSWTDFRRTTCRSSVAGLFSLVTKWMSFWREILNTAAPSLLPLRSSSSKPELFLSSSLSLDALSLPSLSLPCRSDMSLEVSLAFSLLFFFPHFRAFWVNLAGLILRFLRSILHGF